MNHLLTITVTASADGRSIKQFLREELHFSMHQISRVKYRPEGFSINGRSAWVNEILHTGDALTFALDAPDTAARSNAQNTPDAGRSPAAFDPVTAAGTAGVSSLFHLYEDDFLLAAFKPAGMVSHPSHGHRGDSALDLLTQSCGRLYLIGRLDKDTSGILLFARHEETASLLSKQKENGQMAKTYLAAASGILPAEGTIDLPIGVAREYPLQMKTDPEGGKNAVTHFKTLSAGKDEHGHPCSILSVTIEHGRTHQIRVHLSSIGHPLLGDTLYGDVPFEDAVHSAPYTASAAAEKKTHAFLHASSLRFLHPYERRPLRIEAPDPEWLHTLLRSPF